MGESRYRRFEERLEERHPWLFRTYVVVGTGGMMLFFWVLVPLLFVVAAKAVS